MINIPLTINSNNDLWIIARALQGSSMPKINRPFFIFWQVKENGGVESLAQVRLITFLWESFKGCFKFENKCSQSKIDAFFYKIIDEEQEKRNTFILRKVASAIGILSPMWS